MILGVDVGVREVYVVGLPDEYDDNQDYVVAKVDSPRTTRSVELRALVMGLSELAMEGDTVFVEEPPLAGRMNVRTFGQLSMTAGAILSATSAQGYVVPVSTWKKAVVGNGNSDKAAVSAWLAREFPTLHALCQGDQNFVDAACIALYGCRASEAADRIAAVGSGDMDTSL